MAPGDLALLPLVLALVISAAADDATAAAQMAPQEKAALYAAIAGFVGREWNGSGVYPDPCGWTPIQGVSCDVHEDGLWHPTVITVGPVLDNSLQCAPDASFTPHLFRLTHLRTLTLYSCFAAGRNAVIPPAGWDALSSSLESLEFRSNPGLTGPVPSSIGSLTALQSLVIIGNSVSGELPPELSGLRNLRRLVIADNRISGPIPVTLGANMSDLLILDMSRNDMAGLLPPSLGRMTSLLKMDLSGNALTGGIPAEFSSLRSLTLLDLRSNRLSNALVDAIQGMVSLQELVLSNNPLGGGLGGLDWPKLANLTTLDLSNAGLGGSIPDSITGLKKLRFLALDRNQLTGSVPRGLQEMPQLAGLHLHGNRLGGELGFGGQFYRRMGRRFAAWGNLGLCYRPEGMQGVAGPQGVQECKVLAPTAERRSEGSAGSVGPVASRAALVGGSWWFVGVMLLVVLLIMQLE